MRDLAKTILSGTLRVARGTATAMGLAVMLAVVLGVGTTALAAVPGDPFKLGRINTIGKITQLVGGSDSAMLRIDNDSQGPNATALELQVDPKKPPMRVDSFTKVEKLNADLLDGQSAGQFVPLGGKAFDSDHLDGRDSTSFADGTGGKADDADKLDGLDSTHIGINGYVNIRKDSAFDSSTFKFVSVDCPPGKEVVGGGANVFPSLFDSNRVNAPIALRTNGPDLNGFERWDVEAVETQPYGFEWMIFARVICANVGNP
jgi:hypothetical protein